MPLPPLLTGLVYTAVDAVAFGTPTPGRRVVHDDGGVSLLDVPGDVVAPVALPSGATVVELAVGARATTAGGSVMVVERGFSTYQVQPLDGMYLPVAGAPATTAKPTAILVRDDATYTVTANLTATDQAVRGVRLGYVQPNQAFQAVPGAPRVYDSRATAKLAPGEERVIALGVPGTVTGVVLTLTVTETEGDGRSGGFVAAFRAGIAWPGSSSINWTGAGRDVANTTICAVDGGGRVVVRGGGQATHVVVDLVGVLL